MTCCQLRREKRSIPEKLAGFDANPLGPLPEREASIVRVVPVVLRAVLVHAENAEAVRVPVDENVDARLRPLVSHEAEELQRGEVGVAFALLSASGPGVYSYREHERTPHLRVGQ